MLLPLKSVKVLLPECILFISSIVYFFSPWSYPYLIKKTFTSISLYCVVYAILQFLIFKIIWPWSKSTKVRNPLLTNAQPVIKLGSAVLLILGLWIMAHVMFVLFGAPFFNLVLETTVSSALLSILICCPSLVLLGSNFLKWYQVIICGKYTNNQERFVYLHSAFVVFGTWISAVVIPLDWDRPWQEWPIPCACGTIFGHCLALLGNSLLSLKEMKSSGKVV